ncbi:hypothetical protein [Natrinema halophilum]|uniref:Uncharacterized protein n=1 Tax=Natrinema halophilum TaxID=1699371 RepID=A0A7D5KI50_9EURY|nr:hypothetical protein [Natrinema halophilum]QLG48139.1 hypothetical protein HYG82_04400 [Natrinema halophilum]
MVFISGFASLGVTILQGGILVILLEAIRRRDIAAAVNAVVSFAAVFLPLLVEVVAREATSATVSVGPELPLWIAVAGFLHSIGMLGPYDSIRWWDSLTHTVSAMLVAALVYAGLIVVARNTAAVGRSSGGVVVLTILIMVAVGVFWELIELVARDVGERYDVEPVLVHYGWRDTALDLVFDMVGTLLVVVLDLRLFVPLAAEYPNATRRLLTWSIAVILPGSLLMALIVHVGRKR